MGKGFALRWSQNNDVIVGSRDAARASESAMEYTNLAKEAFGEIKDERLLCALEAGRDAGGQATESGEPLAERSAVLMVRGDDVVEDLDLRVDASDDAIGDLRRVHAAYVPYLPYYHLRARDPAHTPPQDVWARDNLGKN